MPDDKVELVHVVLAMGGRDGQNWSTPTSISSLARHQVVTNQDPMDRPTRRHGADSQVGQRVVDGLCPPKSQGIAFALELAMDVDHHPLDRDADLPDKVVWPVRSILGPNGSSRFVSPDPSIDPGSTPPQRSGNPTDGRSLQPQKDTSISFGVRDWSFFQSLAFPPSWWNAVYPDKVSRISCQFLSHGSLVM